MKSLYQAQVVSQGGRNGQIKSSDGILNMKVSLPKEMGGVGGATNPEQLFAAGYAACFENALIFVAKTKSINPGPTSVTATVGIGLAASGGFQLSVRLDIALPSLEKATAEQLIEAAHEVCPYSNATRGNIDVALDLVEHKN